jgi:two-component system, OmpR family, KDP operon response regulator KdpE
MNPSITMIYGGVAVADDRPSGERTRTVFGTAPSSLATKRVTPDPRTTRTERTRGHPTLGAGRGGPRVLVCDGESQTLRGLRVVLHGAGFEVDATTTGKEALDRAALRMPDAALIELLLPDGDGVALCQRLREWSATPLIVLSAVGDEEQKVRALEAGADDYLTKPFGPRELVARLHAIMRRARYGDDQPAFHVGGLEINLASRVVRREGEEVCLTPIEFKLLRALVGHPGCLLTHTTLLREVWGTAYEDNRQTLRAHIANLRRKLEPAGGPPLIRTDHGVGYRFTDWRNADRAPRPLSEAARPPSPRVRRPPDTQPRRPVPPANVTRWQVAEATYRRVA